MLNFEYGDFYKFVTSLGIALILISVLTPWIFLKEPFDLLLQEEELFDLTPLAQEIIQVRQITIKTITKVIPYFSAFVFFIGIIITIFGGYKWWSKTQIVVDRINDLKSRKLEQELRELSPEEVQEKRREEVRAEVPEDHDLLVEEDLIKSATDAEEELINLLKKCLSSRYEVLTNRRLGMAYYDAVLTAKNLDEKDIIIEIKYIRKGFKYGWLRDNVMKLIYSNQIYESEIGRTSIPLLIVIGARNVLETIATKKYYSRANEEVKRIDGRVLVMFRDETMIRELSCDDINDIVDSANAK